MKKILYFEGAGCVPCNDVENCRIRTAFTTLKGQKVYIEFLSGGGINEGALFCDYCFYITDNPEVDDCNCSRLPCERNNSILKPSYTKENILNFVNKNCNADFDKIVILDYLAGFRVHSGKGQYNTSERYNFGDVFNYDADLTRRRIEKVEEMKKEFCALFNQEYDNTSYWIDDNGQLNVKICVSDNQLKKAGWTKPRHFIVEL